MRNTLLTGAGFTKNFGAPLAKELWDWIVNDEKVQEHQGVLSLFRQHYLDFEAVLHEVVIGAYEEPAKVALRSSVEASFRRIDLGLQHLHDNNCGSYPDTHGVNSMIQEFTPRKPDRHGYFFTVNQDLFVERHGDPHFGPVLFGPKPRPGCAGPHLSQRPLERVDLKDMPNERELASSLANLKTHYCLHYIKLHGSHNWAGPHGMVLGGSKPEQIDSEPLLRWSLQHFSEVLAQPGRRLVVIGYGFRDHHVNEAIANATVRSGLRIVVICPEDRQEFEQQVARQPRGEEICRALWRKGGHYYRYALAEMFPQGASGPDYSENWKEVRSCLRSDPP